MRPGPIEMFPSTFDTRVRRLIITADFQVKPITVAQGMHGGMVNLPYFQTAEEGDILIRRIPSDSIVGKIPTITAKVIGKDYHNNSSVIVGEDLVDIINALSPLAQKFLYHDNIGVQSTCQSSINTQAICHQ